MDLGLYQLKYGARKLIMGVLPLVKNVNPNTVSWMLIPVGLGTALCYFYAPNGHPELFLVGIGLVLLRMFLGTLDGLMAEHYKKSSPAGEIVNRLTPEICDVMYLIAIAASCWGHLGLGMLALGIAWLTTFAGLIGLAVGKPIQSVGPVGQTDRLAALMVFSLLAYLANVNTWPVDFIALFLIWCILGGVITIIIRLYRNFKKE